MLVPKSIGKYKLLLEKPISKCLSSSMHQKFSTVKEFGLFNDKKYDYILSGNLVATNLSSSWISIQSSSQYNRGIYATTWIPTGTTILEEAPIASVLRKGTAKSPHDIYCPQCFLPQPEIHDGHALEHIYCTEACAQESMMIHQIKEYKQVREKFVSQLRYYPVLAINLIFEVLKQYKLMSRSPLYESLKFLSYIKHSDIPKVWEDDYSIIKDTFLKDPTRQKYFTLEWYSRIMSIFDLNTFGIPSPSTGSSVHKSSIGSALYLASSFFNHSCTPSALVSFSGNRISVVLSQDVQQGEQIFISYLDPESFTSKDELTNFLQRKYGFTCKCSYCVPSK